MKIALTGTPGVGKSEVSKILKKMGYKILRIDEIYEKFVVGYDEQRNSKIVDEKKMDKEIKKIKEEGVLIIEGHLSHLMSVDGVIILRCHPEELKRRLIKKGWGENKIRENAEAEALDIILQKALQKHKNIWEIDVTDKSIKEVAEEIRRIIEEKIPPNYGKIDYSEWLIENAR
ncbi:MAG: adenylate kinase family protein [Thermoplasmatales archaeon]|nr:adenylate kinase family protein [Thermoplasmatales archaeon]